MSWRNDALCKDADPRLYDADCVPVAERRAHAERVCFGCPVKVECAKDAIRMGDNSVIRAGLPLPPSLTACRDLLLPVVEGRVVLVSEKLRKKWDSATCRLCGSLLRPQRSTPAEFPGTKLCINKTLCRQCWDRLKKEPSLCPQDV